MDSQASRTLFEEALAAGSARDYARAVELLTSLLVGDEGGAEEGEAEREERENRGREALLYLGRSWQALGEAGRAVEAFRHYLRAGGDAATGHFFLGRAWLAAGLHEEAAQAFRKSATADPGRAQTWALLGAACLKLKRSRLAVECLEKAIGLAPADKRIYRGYLNALFVRAARLVSRGEDELARQILGFLIDNGADGAAARLWRAKALRNLGRPREALADCETALASSPEDESLRWLHAGLLLEAGRQAEGLEAMRGLRGGAAAGEPLPRDPAALARYRAAAAFSEGRWKEAAEEALLLLKARQPGAPAAEEAALRALIAQSLRELGQTERAAAHWERAIHADPRSPDLRLGLALCFFDLADYPQALTQAEAARALGAPESETEYISLLALTRSGADPDTLIPRLQRLIRERARGSGTADPRLLFALGESLYRSGRPDLALTWFDQVLRLVPDHEMSLLYRISVAESLGDQEAGLQASAAYIAAYPDNEKIRRELVNLLVSLERWEAAAAILEGGLAYGDPGEGARRLLARAWREEGRYREAALIYRDLLRASPSDGELLLALCLCLDRDGKGDHALALLEAAPAAAKKRAAPWIVIGVLHSRRGHTEKAVDALRTATELEPGTARAWRELAAIYAKGGLHEFAASAAAKAKAAELATARRRRKAEAGLPPDPLPRPEAPVAAVDALAQVGRQRAAAREAAPAKGKAPGGAVRKDRGLPA
jgi:tetratricopeptide (TPR) repeat protein